MSSGKSKRSDPINSENRKSFLNLANSIQNKQVIALVGAGVSAACGYPTWDKLLDILHVKAAAPALTKLQKDMLWRAEEYRSKLGEKPYRTLLSRLFAPEKQVTDELVRLLVKLDFKHFLTTNYDDTISRAHRAVGSSQKLRVIEWSRDAEVREFITGLGDPGQAKHCVHLHGHFKSPESIVLTDSDYMERYARSPITARKLFVILATQRVLFVGFSLEDPDLVSLLREVNATLGSEEPRHFALLPLDRGREDPTILRSRMRRKFGVDPVFYSSTTNHERLDTLLRLLLEGNPSDAASRLPLLHEPLRRRSGPENRLAINPEDPQKGQFGGRAERNARLLQAQVEDTHDGWFVVTLEVVATRGGAALLDGEKVSFHLHDTFADNPRVVAAKHGKAVLELDAWGAFTVGAELQSDRTRLELDLSELPRAPKAFKNA